MEQLIARLLAQWPREYWPVLHVVHDSQTVDSPLHPGQPGNAIKVEALPVGGEVIFLKTVNSAFIGTDLETYLRRQQIKALTLAGLTTNHCVSTTARMAANLGFTTRVVADATGAFGRLTVSGRRRSADEVHEAALSDLHGKFATVVDSASLF